MPQNVLEGGKPIAACSQLRMYGRLGEHRDFRLQRRVARGESSLHVVEDGGVERLAEADADHLVGGRPRARVNRRATSDGNDERPQAGVERGGALRNRDHLSRFGLIDPRRQVRGTEHGGQLSNTWAAMIIRWTSDVP